MLGGLICARERDQSRRTSGRDGGGGGQLEAHSGVEVLPPHVARAVEEVGVPEVVDVELVDLEKRGVRAEVAWCGAKARTAKHGVTGTRRKGWRMSIRDTRDGK